MTGTPVRDAGDWSSPTHYGDSVAVEPRMFTEADPMTSLLAPDWDLFVDGSDERAAAAWGSTTYVGRAARKRTASGAPSTTGTPTAGASVAGPPSTDAPPADTAIDGHAEPGTATATEADSNHGLLSNSRSMAIASLISRVTGFARTALLAVALGIADVANAYNSGNNFPNMVYELLLGGVLSSVLIPLLVHAQAEDDDDGVAYTQRLLSVATVALGVLTFAAVLAAPLIAAGFSPRDNPKLTELTSVFATLLLPEIFFYGLGAMLMAVLNIRHSYAAGAWSPVLNNVIMIATLAVFWVLPGPNTLTPSSITTPQIVVLGVGTTLGIAAQALVLLPALRRTGFSWQWRFRARPNEVGRMREVGTLAGWVLVYVLASQIGVSVIQYVGLHNKGFSSFTNADLLFQMPYGILVVSLLTAIMPRLSRAAVRDDMDSVKSDLSLAARLSAVALIPVTAGLVVLGSPLGVTLFGYGNTSIVEGRLIGSSLAWSAFGLFPFALVMVQLRVFYALRDGRSPTFINIGMVSVKVALVLSSYAVYGSHHHHEQAARWLNIATSASYVVGATAGHILLTRRLGRLGFGPVWRTVAQIGGASVLGGAVAWASVRLARHALGTGHAASAAGLVGGGLVGLAVLGAIAWRMTAVREIFAQVRR